MAVTLTQSAVEARNTANNAAATPATITIAAGDVLLIMEMVGRAISWQSQWQIDGGTPLTALYTLDESTEHARLYAVTGLSPGSHTITATNPAAGGTAGTGIVHALLVVHGADPAGLTSGAVQAATSGNTSATKSWPTGPVAAGGAAIGLQASRRGAAVASVSDIDLGSSHWVPSGGLGYYASGALQAILPPAGTAGETLTVTMGGTGAGGRIGIILDKAATTGTTGTLNATLPTTAVAVPAATWTGTTTPPAHTGAIDTVLPGATITPPTSAWTGTTDAPRWAGALNAPLPQVTIQPPGSTWTGSVTPPGAGGSLTTTLPALTISPPAATWAGGATVPVYSGLLDSDTPHTLIAVPLTNWAGGSLPPTGGSLTTGLPPITIGTPTAAWRQATDVQTPESRTLRIAPQDRTMVIAPQDRTITITGGSS